MPASVVHVDVYACVRVPTGTSVSLSVYMCVYTGDVVICVRPVDPSEHVIKRVVAVAGEEVLLYPSKDSAEIRKVKASERHAHMQQRTSPGPRPSKGWKPGLRCHV